MMYLLTSNEAIEFIYETELKNRNDLNFMKAFMLQMTK